MTATAQSPNPLARVFALRDFRLLFAGATTSVLGDQFALIAMPWLTLQLTGDPLALGTVFALEGIPRAAIMLFGGVLTDRLSPRRMMLASDAIRCALTAILALAVFTGRVELWMLYTFSLCFGIVAGFAMPAESSIVAMLVKSDDLQAGNSVMMGVNQLVGFIGPSLAGIIIGGYAHSLAGIGLAFGVDSASFAVSAGCLMAMLGGQIGAPAKAGAPQPDAESVWAAIRAGLDFLWKDRVLRLMFLVLTAVNFLVSGPIMVGIPVLADRVLPEGAVAFGLLMSAYAGGNLVGFLLAGSLPRPGKDAMRVITVGFLVGFAAVMASLGLVRTTWVDFATLLTLGIGNGYIAIIMITWMQNRTPKELLGRMMSLFSFSQIGLIPISQALSGAISKWNLPVLFLGSGILILAVTAWMASQPELEAFSESLAGVDIQPARKKAIPAASGE